MMLSINNFKNYFKLPAFILAILMAFILEFYMVFVENYVDLSVYGDIIQFLNASLPFFSKKLLIIFFILFFIVFTILFNPKIKIKVLNFIYNNRFYLAFGVFVVAVILQIHGSSISLFNISNSNHDSLLGVARLIRSDEFNVNTPFALSQYFNDFGYFSDIVRGVPTDMFISYGQPVLDFAIIFRPFHWGYLFLSQGFGLSFFWVGRLIALFVVSFEFGRLITNNNKKLALAYSILVTFSPVVQWWFAINMLVEMLIFGQLIIILTNYYMNTNDYRKKLFITLISVILFGGYILALYPAWEIPFAYVFAIFFVWVVYKNYKTFNLHKKDLYLFLLFIVILSISLGYIFLKSYPTITTIMNTVYPGSRAYFGGLDIFRTINPLFSYFKSIITPFVLNNIFVETTSTIFVSFFPFGIILFALMWIVQKKKDILSLVLLALEVLFIIYMVFTLPNFIGNLTLLKGTVEIRLITVIFFINLLILIRCLSICKLNIKKYYRLICLFVSFIISGFGVYFSFYPITNQIMIIHAIISFILFATAFFFILMSCFNKKYLKGFLISVIAISFLTGAFVNPVESGLDFYYNQEVIQEVSSIVNQNPNANWIVTTPFFINEIIPVGAHTINSVNIYPNFELWSKFDHNGENIDSYNRYAHLPVTIQNESPTIFNNYQNDVIEINLNVNDIKKINVTYILTKDDLSMYSNENISFVEIYQDNAGNKIFEVN